MPKCILLNFLEKKQSRADNSERLVSRSLNLVGRSKFYASRVATYRTLSFFFHKTASKQNSICANGCRLSQIQFLISFRFLFAKVAKGMSPFSIFQSSPNLRGGGCGTTNPFLTLAA